MVTRVAGSTYELKNSNESTTPFQLLSFVTSDSEQGTTDDELLDVLIDRMKYKNSIEPSDSVEVIIETLQDIKKKLYPEESEIQ